MLHKVIAVDEEIKIDWDLFKDEDYLELIKALNDLEQTDPPDTNGHHKKEPYSYTKATKATSGLSEHRKLGSNRHTPSRWGLTEETFRQLNGIRRATKAIEAEGLTKPEDKEPLTTDRVRCLAFDKYGKPYIASVPSGTKLVESSTVIAPLASTLLKEEKVSANEESEPSKSTSSEEISKIIDQLKAVNDRFQIPNLDFICRYYDSNLKAINSYPIDRFFSTLCAADSALDMEALYRCYFTAIHLYNSDEQRPSSIILANENTIETFHFDRGSSAKTEAITTKPLFHKKTDSPLFLLETGHAFAVISHTDKQIKFRTLDTDDVTASAQEFHDEHGLVMGKTIPSATPDPQSRDYKMAQKRLTKAIGLARTYEETQMGNLDNATSPNGSTEPGADIRVYKYPPASPTTASSSEDNQDYRKGQGPGKKPAGSDPHGIMAELSDYLAARYAGVPDYESEEVEEVDVPKGPVGADGGSPTHNHPDDMPPSPTAGSFQLNNDEFPALRSAPPTHSTGSDPKTKSAKTAKQNTKKEKRALEINAFLDKLSPVKDSITTVSDTLEDDACDLNSASSSLLAAMKALSPLRGETISFDKGLSADLTVLELRCQQIALRILQESEAKNRPLSDTNIEALVSIASPLLVQDSSETSAPDADAVATEMQLFHDRLLHDFFASDGASSAQAKELFDAFYVKHPDLAEKIVASPSFGRFVVAKRGALNTTGTATPFFKHLYNASKVHRLSAESSDTKIRIENAETRNINGFSAKLVQVPVNIENPAMPGNFISREQDMVWVCTRQLRAGHYHFITYGENGTHFVEDQQNIHGRVCQHDDFAAVQARGIQGDHCFVPVEDFAKAMTGEDAPIAEAFKGFSRRASEQKTLFPFSENNCWFANAAMEARLLRLLLPLQSISGVTIDSSDC